MLLNDLLVISNNNNQSIVQMGSGEVGNFFEFYNWIVSKLNLIEIRCKIVDRINKDMCAVKISI